MIYSFCNMLILDILRHISVGQDSCVVTLMSLSSYNYSHSEPNVQLDIVLSQVVGYL